MAENLIPIAVSSELDVAGEERIHVVNRAILVRPAYIPFVPETFVGVTSYYSGAGGSSNWFFTEAYQQLAGNFNALTVDVQPTSVGRGGGWSKDAQHYVVPQDANPFFAFYKRTGTALVKQPAITFTGNKDIGWSATWNSTSTRLALGMRGNTTSFPFVTIFSRSGDTYTQVAEIYDASPTALNRASSLSYNADGTKLAVVTNNATGLSLYDVVGDTYTKVISPGTIPSGSGRFCAFSGEYLAYTHGGLAANSPLTVYKLAGSTLTTVFQNTTDGAAKGCSWNQDGTKLAVQLSNAQGRVIWKVYNRVGDVFTEVLSVNWFDEGTFASFGEAMTAWTPDRLLVTSEELKKVFVYDAITLAAIPAEDIVLAHPDMKPTEFGLSAVTTNV